MKIYQRYLLGFLCLLVLVPASMASLAQSGAQNQQSNSWNLYCLQPFCSDKPYKENYKNLKPLIEAELSRISEWFDELSFGHQRVGVSVSNKRIISIKALGDNALAEYARYSGKIFLNKDPTLTDQYSVAANRNELSETLAHELFHSVQKNYIPYISEGTAEAVGYAWVMKQGRSSDKVWDPSLDVPIHRAIKEEDYYYRAAFYLWLGNKIGSVDKVGYLKDFREPPKISADDSLMWFDDRLKHVAGEGFGRLYPEYVRDESKIPTSFENTPQQAKDAFSVTLLSNVAPVVKQTDESKSVDMLAASYMKSSVKVSNASFLKPNQHVHLVSVRAKGENNLDDDIWLIHGNGQLIMPNQSLQMVIKLAGKKLTFDDFRLVNAPDDITQAQYDNVKLEYTVQQIKLKDQCIDPQETKALEFDYLSANRLTAIAELKVSAGRLSKAGEFTAPKDVDEVTVSIRTTATQQSPAQWVELGKVEIGCSREISPRVHCVALDSTQQFIAVNKEEERKQDVHWQVQGDGQISAKGLYTPGSRGGKATITITNQDAPYLVKDTLEVVNGCQCQWSAQVGGMSDTGNNISINNILGQYMIMPMDTQKLIFTIQGQGKAISPQEKNVVLEAFGKSWVTGFFGESIANIPYQLKARPYACPSPETKTVEWHVDKSGWLHGAVTGQAVSMEEEAGCPSTISYFISFTAPTRNAKSAFGGNDPFSAKTQIVPCFTADQQK